MPMQQTVRITGFSPAEIALMALVFCTCLAGAALLPVDQCPDEYSRRLLSDWIFQTGTLPTGNEMETIIFIDEGETWGFSYALRPYLSSIIGAGCMVVAACFTDSESVLLVASRMASVLSMVAVCFFCLRTGHRLFRRRSSAVLFAAFVCFLPQAAFVGMYQNCDALSLAATAAIVYYLVEGLDTTWSPRSCVGLGIAFSVGLLSYYSIYGWILTAAVFCLVAVARSGDIAHKGRFIAKRAAIVAGICLVLAGWFFIRNALLHQGDFLGLTSEQASRDRLAEQGFEIHPYISARDDGLSVLDFIGQQGSFWLKTSVESFVGMFGYMDIVLPTGVYLVYFAIFLTGIALFARAFARHEIDDREKLLFAMMLVASVITFFLSFWQSYARDFQPQGRYIITIALLLGFLLACGVDRMTFGFPPAAAHASESTLRAYANPANALTLTWLALFAFAAAGTMTRMLP